MAMRLASSMLVAALFVAHIATLVQGVPLPVDQELLLLDEDVSSLDSVAPKAKVAAKKHVLRKNGMGTIDGSRGSWFPFVNKAPMEALVKGRTFLPKTATEFQKPVSFKDKGLDSVQKELAQAENIHARSKYLQKVHAEEVKAAKLKAAQAKKKAKAQEKREKRKKKPNVLWPLGKPTFKPSQTSLQLKNKKVWRADGPIQDDVFLQSDDTYDPIQDMLEANGWTKDVLSTHAASQEQPVQEDTSTVSHSDVARTVEQHSEGDDARDLGESANVEQDDHDSATANRSRARASAPHASAPPLYSTAETVTNSDVNTAEKDYDTSRSVRTTHKHTPRNGDDEHSFDDLLTVDSDSMDGADAP